MAESFLTVGDVAELLKLNPQTVRNWIDQGQLPAVRIGRRVRIRQSELDAFIEAGTTRKPSSDGEPDSGPRAEVGRALEDVQMALHGTSDAELLAALDRLASSVTTLADAVRAAGS